MRLCDVDLLRLCDLPVTLKTLWRVKMRLREQGLIDYTAGNGTEPTVYRLVSLCAADDTDNLGCGTVNTDREHMSERVVLSCPPRGEFLLYARVNM